MNQEQEPKDIVNTYILEALRDAEAGLVFAGGDKPYTEFVPITTKALQEVRAAIKKLEGPSLDDRIKKAADFLYATNPYMAEMRAQISDKFGRDSAYENTVLNFTAPISLSVLLGISLEDLAEAWLEPIEAQYSNHSES